MLLYFFFFNDTATTEIYTLSLHDALPISSSWSSTFSGRGGAWRAAALVRIEFGGHDGVAEIARHGAFAAQRGLQAGDIRSEEHTSELQSQSNLVCRLLLVKKKLDIAQHRA